MTTEETRPIVYGPITGYIEGHHFDSRLDMIEDSFHRKQGYGIDEVTGGSAAAVVLSNGYHDEDFGSHIIYTGSGKNKNEDQSWEQRSNKGLLNNIKSGIPVRVIRGHQIKSKYSPKNGYSYGGLYRVTSAWSEKSDDSYYVCKFKLEYIGNDNSKYDSKKERQYGYTSGKYFKRDQSLATEVKKLYDYECQICGIKLPTIKGFYAEAAHIKPVGHPHEGPDELSNMLCLCPNHHKMFDKGGFSIADDLSLLGCVQGTLTIDKSHEINKEHLTYHRIFFKYFS